jgi:PQQ-like domain
MASNTRLKCVAAIGWQLMVLLLEFAGAARGGWGGYASIMGLHQFVQRRHPVLVGLVVVVMAATGCGRSSRNGSASGTNQSSEFGNGPSKEALCRSYVDQAISFRRGIVGQKGLGTILPLLSSANDLAVMFDNMTPLAPADISSDVAVVRDAFKKQASSIGDAADPLKSLVAGLSTGATSSGSFDRVDHWLSANCATELERLKATTSYGAVTTVATRGTIAYDHDIDCSGSGGSVYVDNGPARHVDAQVTKIVGIVTVRLAAVDANQRPIQSTEIKGPDLDGTGGEGVFSFDTPKGGFTLSWDDKGNPLGGCSAHLVLYESLTTGSAEPTAGTDVSVVADGALVASIQRNSSSRCEVASGLVIVGGSESRPAERVQFFDTTGQRVAAHTPPPETTASLAGVDEADNPIVVQATVTVTAANGIKPATATGSLTRINAIDQSKTWTVEMFAGKDLTTRHPVAVPRVIVGNVAALLQITPDGFRAFGINLTTGNEIWSRKTPEGFNPSIDKRHLQIYDSDLKKSVTIEVATGSVISTDAGGTSFIILPDRSVGWSEGHAKVLSSNGSQLLKIDEDEVAVTKDGSVVVASGSKGTSAYRTTDGSVLWSTPAGSVHLSHLVVSGDFMYATTTNGQHVILGLSDGRQLHVDDARDIIVPGIQVGDAFVACSVSPALIYKSTSVSLGVLSDKLFRP